MSHSKKSLKQNYITNEIKCLNTCQLKIKFVLSFTKNDLTFVEIYAITFNLRLEHMPDQRQVNTTSAQTSDCYFICKVDVHDLNLY